MGGDTLSLSQPSSSYLPDPSVVNQSRVGTGACDDKFGSEECSGFLQLVIVY